MFKHNIKYNSCENIFLAVLYSHPIQPATDGYLKLQVYMEMAILNYKYIWYIEFMTFIKAAG